MNQTLRENLEIERAGAGAWIRCTKCGHRLCAFGQDWRAAALRRSFSPVKAGTLMNILEGRYLFEKLYCPACGVLLDAKMVEEKHEA
ncbi:MAG: hypothetical protein ACREP5_10120 [Candidatus Binatia bacterium]